MNALCLMSAERCGYRPHFGEWDTNKGAQSALVYLPPLPRNRHYNGGMQHLPQKIRVVRAEQASGVAVGKIDLQKRDLGRRRSETGWRGGKARDCPLPCLGARGG